MTIIYLFLGNKLKKIFITYIKKYIFKPNLNNYNFQEYQENTSFSFKGNILCMLG